MQIAPYYWFDGKIQARKNVNIDRLAHGLHYGTGVFEGLRAYATSQGPAVFRLREHMRRFGESAAVYGLNLGAGVDQLCEAALDTLIANDLETAYIRPLAFFGEKEVQAAIDTVLKVARAAGKPAGIYAADGAGARAAAARGFSLIAFGADILRLTTETRRMCVEARA